MAKAVGVRPVAGCPLLYDRLSGRSPDATTSTSVKLDPLPSSFYEASASAVAPALLGHWLVRRIPRGGWSGGIIVETEAYLVGDPASHGFKGETPRNRAMFGPPGRAYVYFIYGNHWCFNTVCRPSGQAEGVLVRAIQPTLGVEWMKHNRPVADAVQLTNGPAKLCAALRIDRRLDGTDVCDATSPIIIASNPDRESVVSSCGPVVTTTRIGLSQAAELPLRFYLAGSEWVSRRERLVKRKSPVARGATGEA